jgi:uncharacterized protein YbjQ (UPF0145 family)
MKTFQTTLLICCVLILAGCATGSHIITGEVRPAIDPNLVKLYLEPPSEYEEIGIVRGSSDDITELFSTQTALDGALQELKKQAAQIGANGVLLMNTSSASNTSGFYSESVYHTIDTETKTATGKAILVYKK